MFKLSRRVYIHRFATNILYLNNIAFLNHYPLFTHVMYCVITVMRTYVLDFQLYPL